jgi:5-dehydro-2-deoxygluconokinase
MSVALDLITVGRVSVDLYATELGVSFLEPQTFAKSIGGSPTNVAVAAAQYGLAAAVVTKVGSDQLGEYVRTRLAEFGVDIRFVGIDSSAPTPVVLAALDPPEDPQIAFYRGAAAPDTTCSLSDVSEQEIRSARAFWMSVGALAQGSTAEASFEWLAMRNRAPFTILDLDYRPTLWPDVATARAAAQRAIASSTVVLGNRAECEMAIGETEPDAAADALLALGIELAIIKMGGGGVLLATSDERIRVTPVPITVVCGLGAGDAFGGALVYGLLSGWPLAEVGAFANAAGGHVAGELTCADAMPKEVRVRELMKKGATS